MLRRARLAGISIALVPGLAFLAGCSGGANHSSIAPSTTSATTQSGKTQVTFRIDVPKTGAAVDRRSAQYISPATTQMLIDIEENSVEVTGYPKTVSLTPTSGGCTSTLASTNCQLTVSLSQGSNYTATLTTEDASGNALSSAQMIAFTVGSSASTVAIALSGIPHTILVSSGAIAVHGSASAGFTLYGSAAQPLIVTALDADGDTIVGPGAPTFMATPVSGTGWSANAPSNTAPNSLAITPPGTNGSGATFSVSASYDDSTCSDTGAVCTATFTIKNDIQSLIVANSGNKTVTEYVPPFTGAPTLTLSTGASQPFDLALNPGGDLFIAKGGTGMDVYAPPFTGAASNPISSGLFANWSIGFDAGGDLFAANANNTVVKYTPPYTSAPLTINLSALSGNNATGFAIDANGDLFVANTANNTVYAIPPPYTVPTTITSGVSGPYAIAVDVADDLFVANFAANTITEYAPPYTGAPTATISNGISSPYSLALDGAGNLFVGSNGGVLTVNEYAPPYTGPPARSFGTGVYNPNALLVDGAGNLFIENANSTIAVYAPPYTGAPTVISSGISNPDSLIVTR